MRIEVLENTVTTGNIYSRRGWGRQRNYYQWSKKGDEDHGIMRWEQQPLPHCLLKKIMKWDYLLACSRRVGSEKKIKKWDYLLPVYTRWNLMRKKLPILDVELILQNKRPSILQYTLVSGLYIRHLTLLVKIGSAANTSHIPEIYSQMQIL